MKFNIQFPEHIATVIIISTFPTPPYHISSESLEFCWRYHRKHFWFFFRTHCI